MANDKHRLQKELGSTVPIPQFKDKETGFFTPHTGDEAPFYQMVDNEGQVIGKPNPLSIQHEGCTLEEQKTQLDAVTGKLTFTKNISFVGIYNRDTVNDGVFNVNGFNITVPKGEAVDFRVSGTPTNTVNISGSNLYIVSRYE